MAYATTTTHHSIWASIADMFAAFGRGLTLSATGEKRLRQVEKLNALSDADLAKLGLKRADIPAYVFRDLMHI